MRPTVRPGGGRGSKMDGWGCGEGEGHLQIFSSLPLSFSFNIFHVNSTHQHRRQHRRRRRLSPIHLFPLLYSLPPSPLSFPWPCPPSHFIPSFAPQNVFASPRGVRPFLPFGGAVRLQRRSPLSLFVPFGAFSVRFSFGLPPLSSPTVLCVFAFVGLFLFMPSSIQPPIPTFQPTGSAPTHSIPSPPHFPQQFNSNRPSPLQFFSNFPIPIPPSNSNFPLVQLLLQFHNPIDRTFPFHNATIRDFFASPNFFMI